MDHGLIRQPGLLVNLHAGKVLRLREAAGRHLTVVRGNLWITQLGERGDPVVAAGETFRFTRAGVSLAQALGGDAVVMLEAGLAPERVADEAPPARSGWALARSAAFQRKARRLRNETLAQLSDHLLRDVGLRRDRIQTGLVSRICTTC
jgi:uncharacterized protein YjiS (DUF1127 family)